MDGVADDDDLSPPPAGVLDDLMDLRHLDAGRVGHGAAHFLQLVIDGLALAVGADDDATARRDLVNALHTAHALLGQMLDHMVVVDHRAEHHIGGVPGGDLLRQLHRPAHAEAEPGRLGQHHLHPWTSRSARVSRMARMCSMMSSVTRS